MIVDGNRYNMTGGPYHTHLHPLFPPPILGPTVASASSIGVTLLGVLAGQWESLFALRLRMKRICVWGWWRWR